MLILPNFTIPPKVTIIPSALFYECDSVSLIIIHNNIESIGSSAFERWPSIKNFTIPPKVSIIENHLFYECRNISSIVILGNITLVYNDTFILH